MATTRVRTKTISSFLTPDESWRSSRRLIASPRISGINCQIFHGIASALPPTRVTGPSAKATLTDEIGSPDASSMNRFFPDALPYRPLSFIGPKDYYGTPKHKEVNIPPAASAHTVAGWTIKSNWFGAANLQYLKNRLQPIGGTRTGTVTSYEPSIKAWLGYGPTAYLEPQFQSEALAISYATGFAASCISNLRKGEVLLEETPLCLARSAYSAIPSSAPQIKNLGSRQDNLLIDRRRDAYESMIHQSGNTQMNVMRSVLELKDAPQTVKGIGEFLKTVAAVSSLSRSRFMSSSSRKKIAELTLGQLAATHLWYQFGVKPTVQDVESFMKQLGDAEVASLAASDKGVLMTGDTVRCAYSLDADVGERRLDNLLLSATQEYSYVTNTKDYEWRRIPFVAAADYLRDHPLDLTLPEGNDWSHKGLLFGRALKPDWTMMPDWFRDLYMELRGGFDCEELLRPSKDDLALYFNPPIRSLWNLTGFSWLADWAWNASAVLKHIERKFTGRVVCAFEELWALDTWVYTPRKWAIIPVAERPSMSMEDISITYEVHADYVQDIGYPNRRWWRPVVTFYNASRTVVNVNPAIRIRWNFALQTPPTTLWTNVKRQKVSIPPIRLPKFFEGKLDAWKIGILCALSITRLASMSIALRKANWSVAKCITMWRVSKKAVDLRTLALAVAGVMAAKEYTYE